MNSLNVNTSGNYYRKQEVVVNCTPPSSDVCSNTRIRVFCSKGQQSMPVPFTVDWKRVSNGLEEPIQNTEGSCYECSPLDVGTIVEARIKYEDDGYQFETARRFGPIRTEPELINLERSVRKEVFRIKLNVENNFIDPTLIFCGEEGITLTRDNIEYRMKIVSANDIVLRTDTRAISIKVRINYQEPLTGYLSTILRRQLKNKAEYLDVIFESRHKRDLFLVLLRNNLRTTSSGSNPYHREDSGGATTTAYNRERDINVSNGAVTKARKNSDNSLVSQSKRRPVEKDKLIPKERQPAVKLALPTNFKTECLNVFDEEDSDFLREFQKDLSSDLPSKRQHALNLRQSFVELEQKTLNTRSRKDLRTQSHEQSSREMKQLRQQLQQSRNQIMRLHNEIKELQQENLMLKQQLGSNATIKEIVQLKQKLNQFAEENKRLENERSNIIADKIAAQVKFERQKQEKQQLKKLLGSSRIPLPSGGGVNISVGQPQPHNSSSSHAVYGKDNIDRRDASRSPYHTADPAKIEASRSTKDIKHRKDSNAKNQNAMVINPINESPSHSRMPAKAFDVEHQLSNFHNRLT